VAGAKGHPALTGDALSGYTTGPTNFLQDAATLPGCSKILTNLYECINDYTTNANFPTCRISNSWFNIQKPDSSLQRHFHCGGPSSSLLSGALYINVDENSSPITFENPNPYITLIGTSRNDNTHTFRPNVGDLILFPSWLYHFSNEINKTKNRIVISFNTI
jgi:uncharacterized protein (TIGR02466 family)